MVDQRAGAIVALTRAGGGQHRHKGLAERAFAQHAAKQVGDTKRHIEGVRHGADAEHRGHQQLAHQARDAGGQGQQRNGGGGLEQGHGRECSGWNMQLTPRLVHFV